MIKEASHPFAKNHKTNPLQNLIDGFGHLEQGCKFWSKCCDSACRVGTTVVRKLWGFYQEIGGKYLFPTSYSGASFFTYKLFEGLQVRKILADVIGMRQNPQIRVPVFLDLWNFHRVIRIQSPTCTPARNSHQYLG